MSFLNIRTTALLDVPGFDNVLTLRRVLREQSTGRVNTSTVGLSGFPYPSQVPSAPRPVYRVLVQGPAGDAVDEAIDLVRRLGGQLAPGCAITTV